VVALQHALEIRVYLRSSPFICLADSVSIITRLVVLSAALRISLSKSFRVLIDEHFGDEDPRSLANTTWLRWLLFILGGLRLVIKMTSFKGTPITKFYGLCYLVSFLLVEMMIFV
jgi:hypothetical protein